MKTKASKPISKWSTKFPTKEGDYWFYGYRYGKISCGQLTEPKCSNGMLYMANGQIMYEKEVEEPHFIPIEFPEKPELKP